ncbi:uncharacterized protein LOC143469537 [Clavelina lepadiformis]|uniref:uncharacterized protein LOC143469537 n=1 Tax=Clavelina lepadiformis TaxID=159417 RepID=UPI0040424AFB
MLKSFAYLLLSYVIVTYQCVGVDARACLDGFIFDVNQCVPCDGNACNKECYGVGHPNGPLSDATSVNADNIENFRGCNVVNGNLVLQSSAFRAFDRRRLLTSYDLLALENITVIKGHLRIEGWPTYQPSFSLFKNLRKIEGETLYNDVIALYVDLNGTYPQGLNWNLGFKSLQSIERGNVFIGYLYGLCYDRLVIWNSVLRSPIQSDGYNNGVLLQNNATAYAPCDPGRDRCADECTDDGCWDSDSSGCLDCVNKVFNGGCVSSCPRGTSIYDAPDSATSRVCFSCDRQCYSTCRGPGPTNCDSCRNFKLNGACVEDCPLEMYRPLYVDSGDCETCHPECIRQTSQFTSPVCNRSCHNYVDFDLQQQAQIKAYVSNTDSVVLDIVKSSAFAFTGYTNQILDTNNLAYDVATNEGYIDSNPAWATTLNGRLKGIRLPEAHAFYGVPYAQPPVGDLRFMPPLPANDYAGSELDVTDRNVRVCPRPCCYTNMGFDSSRGLQAQSSSGPSDVFTQPTDSEDCLLLNVFVPSTVDLSNALLPPSDRLPVMFYLHGGAFYNGAGTSPTTDGRYLSNVTNTIVVTVNYRLGAVGFLVYDDGNEVINGNQGIADQQLALRWVQENIGKFGGDSNRVTIVGNNAGAQSVMFHLMSQKSAPLFQSAILQSWPGSFKYRTREEALDLTKKLLEVSRCTDIACLRNQQRAPVFGIDFFQYILGMGANNFDLFTVLETFAPVIDGEEFTQDPIQYFQNGGWHNNGKNVIIGSNSDEMSLVSAQFPKHYKIGQEAFEAFVVRALGDDVGRQVVERYESYAQENNHTEDYKPVLDKLLTDGLFTCPQRAWARITSNDSTSGNVFMYSFKHAMDNPSCRSTFQYTPNICRSNFHFEEVIFLFRTAPLLKYNFSPSDLGSVDQFSYYWGNFLRSGDPSSSSGSQHGLENTSWPPYKASDQVLMSWPMLVIDSPSGHVEFDSNRDICDFWDKTQFYLGPRRPLTTPNPTTNVTNVDVTNTTELSTTPCTRADNGNCTPPGGNAASLTMSFLLLLFPTLFAALVLM